MLIFVWVSVLGNFLMYRGGQAVSSWQLGNAGPSVNFAFARGAPDQRKMKPILCHWAQPNIYSVPQSIEAYALTQIKA